MAHPDSVGRYRLVRRIARGGMGVVYFAVLDAPGGVRRCAAVKLLAEASGPPQAALLAEARLASLVTHPNVAQLLDAGLEGDIAWFAMEYVSGLSLAELLERGRLDIPPWISARIVADACAALHAVHQARDERGAPLAMVHRDVTPHNLLVSWDGFVKLVDFGIARSMLQSGRTTTGVVKGKVGYMSPEQATGTPLDRRSDVFALGVILWEALAGRPLFAQQTDAETLARIVQGSVPELALVRPTLPARLASVADRALKNDPAARFASALEMQQALELALGSSGVAVGANEVAQVVADTAPERVREHERWLATETPTSDDRTTPRSASPDEPSEASLLEAAPHPTWPASRRRSVLVIGAASGAGIAVALALTPATSDRGSQRTIAPLPSDVRTPAGDGSTAPRPDPRTAASGAAMPEAREAKSPSAAPLDAPVNPPQARAPTLTRVAAGSVASTDAHRAVAVPPQDPSIAAKPSGEPGTLNVTARPTWAAIRIDGTLVGSTPLVVPRLRPGTHIVEALRQGTGTPDRRAIVVEAGREQRIEFELE